MMPWLKKAFLLTAALVLLAELSVWAIPYALKSGSHLASVLPGVLVALTNSERKDNEVATLKPNALLEEAARLKAEDMATRGYFSHVTPEGYTPWYWLDKAGYEYSHAGENLAVNFSDSKDVVDAWMHSPLHRANITKQTYTEIGIAVAEGKYEGKKAVFVVQFFGTPKDASASPQPTQLGSLSGKGASVFDGFFASPRHTADAILLVILVLVIIGLLLSLRHPYIIVVCVILILLILALLGVNHFIIKKDIKISSTTSPHTRLYSFS